MNIKRVLKVGSFILIPVVLVWLLTVSLEEPFESAIERIASDVVKTRVTMSGVQVDMEHGKAEIDRLIIANSVGYSSENMFELRAIEVDFEFGSEKENTLHIKSLRVNDPQTSYEGRGPGGSNLKAMMKNIKIALKKTNISATGKDLKITIASLKINDGQIRASAITAPDEITTVEFAAIEITNIGRAQGGLNTEGAIILVAGELVNATINAASKMGMDRIINKKQKSWTDAFGRDSKRDN